MEFIGAETGAAAPPHDRPSHHLKLFKQRR
jgi:hypothetical protein